MFEKTIIANLVFDNDYTRKTLPFLKQEYFHNPAEKKVFEITKEFVTKYNNSPTKEVLLVELENVKAGLNQRVFDEAKFLVENLNTDNNDKQWLLNTTEKFCQEKAIENGLLTSIRILEGKEKLQKDAIPSILQDALAVSFDRHIGHSYLGQIEDRYAFYHSVEEKIPFDIDILNEITNGGVARKTLNILIAGTNVGKSLGLCHLAANYLMQGKNVLYITLEMAEERIAERVDANLMDTPISDIPFISKENFFKKLENIARKTTGNFYIKEYPTASAHSGHFRHLIEELRLKKNFNVDVLLIDYINICSSSRMKYTNGVNSYNIVKSVAEELRGLGVEFNVPVWTATQTNRQGYSDSDFDLDSSAESFGVPQTADFMLALIATEELTALNQFMAKQLKNRYRDKEKTKRFVIGVDKSKQRFYNVEQVAQEGIQNEATPVFDRTEMGSLDRAQKKTKFDSFGFDDPVPF
jgi:replicative DNA helicase